MSVADSILYDRLGVSPSATSPEIRKAFMKLATKWHPDKNPSPEAVEKFKEINEANTVLSDPEKRQMYDRYGLNGLREGAGSHGGGMDDFLSSFFGGGGGRRQRGPAKTKDLRHALSVTLEDVYNGALKKMKVTKKILCTDCQGSGTADGISYECPDCGGRGQCDIVRQMGFAVIRQTVTCPSCRGAGEAIPAGKTCMMCSGRKLINSEKILEVEIEKGMADGEEIPFRGESHEQPGHISGDVIFVLKVEPHREFERHGNHLIINKDIPLVNALTGYSFVLKHLDGRSLYIPTAGRIISPGTELAVADEGMPFRKWTSDRGTLMIRFRIVFPTSLSDAQRSTLNQCLPDGIAAPKQSQDHIHVQLEDFTKENRQNDNRRSNGGYNNAFDSSSSDDQQGGAVPCNQQ